MALINLYQSLSLNLSIHITFLSTSQFDPFFLFYVNFHEPIWPEANVRIKCWNNRFSQSLICPDIYKEDTWMAVNWELIIVF